MPDETLTCFVIMPFSNTTEAHTEQYWTAHFEGFLRPLISQGGRFEAKRSTALRGDIIKEIISNLITSPVVVADLTDANSNVYWELGVRQSFKHGTITIAEVGTKLPFDIGAKGTLFYHPRDHVKLEEFRKSFLFALNDCLAQPERPDSHVLETLSGRGTIYELIRLDEATRRVEATLAELAFNLGTIKAIKKRAETNQKDSSKRTFQTSLLRLSSCELLMTTRYLDQSREFYRAVEIAYCGAADINNQLGLWENSPNATEKWFLEWIDGHLTENEQLNSLLKDVLTELKRRH